MVYVSIYIRFIYAFICSNDEWGYIHVHVMEELILQQILSVHKLCFEFLKSQMLNISRQSKPKNGSFQNLNAF